MSKLHEIDSDLKCAVEYSGGLDLSSVKGVAACVYGENDEAEWYWVIALKDGTHGLGVGGCDYTGWDCQSWFKFTPAKTALQAAKLAPVKEDGWTSKRHIQKVLIKQLEGTQPFGSIDGEDI